MPYLCTEMWKLFFFIHIVFLSVRCNSNKATNNEIFRLNMEVSVSSLDPVFAKDQANTWAVSQLFNGLLELDSALRISFSLAKNYEVSDSGKVYRFTLRDDVYFHIDPCFGRIKSRKVNANDVVYSFTRLMNPQTASPGSWIFNDKVNDSLPFRAINDTLFELRLKASFPPLLGLLCMPYCAIIPKEAIEYYGQNFRKHPVGTGPFQYFHWEEGSQLLFKANPKYFEIHQGKRLPYIAGIEVRFLENKQTAFLEFLQGKFDLINGIDASFKDELLSYDGKIKPKYQNKFKIKKGPYLNTEYLGLLQNTNGAEHPYPPLLNKDFRKALSFAIPREEMILWIRNGLGIPGNGGFIPEGLPGHAESIGYKYSQDSARFYLKKAGFANGNGLSDLIIHTNKNYLDLTIFIQKKWKEIGIPCKIEVNPGPFHRERVSKGELGCFRGSWLADYPDAENYLALFYSPNFTPAGPNYTRYNNKEVDALYLQAMKETSDSARFGLYAKLDQLVMEDAPVIILYYDQTLHLLQNQVHGFASNPMNQLILKYVTKVHTPNYN